MRVVLVLVTIFCWFTLAGAGAFTYWQLHEARQRLDHIWSDYASAQKSNNALDNLQSQVNVLRNDWASAARTNKALDNIQGQINAIRGDVNRLNGDYPSAQKVEAQLAKLQGQIDGARKELANVPVPAPAPTHFIELGFRDGNDVVLVLRYSGNSLQNASASKSQTRGAAELKNAVKINPNDVKLGVATFNAILVRTPSAHRLISLGGMNPPDLALVRSNADANDWDLTAEGRNKLNSFLRDY